MCIQQPRHRNSAHLAATRRHPQRPSRPQRSPGRPLCSTTGGGRAASGGCPHDAGGGACRPAADNAAAAAAADADASADADAAQVHGHDPRGWCYRGRAGRAGAASGRCVTLFLGRRRRAGALLCDTGQEGRGNARPAGSERNGGKNNRKREGRNRGNERPGNRGTNKNKTEQSSANGARQRVSATYHTQHVTTQYRV